MAKQSNVTLLKQEVWHNSTDVAHVCSVMWQNCIHKQTPAHCCTVGAWAHQLLLAAMFINFTCYFGRILHLIGIQNDTQQTRGS